jgi:hypothetical protein
MADLLADHGPAWEPLERDEMPLLPRAGEVRRRRLAVVRREEVGGRRRDCLGEIPQLAQYLGVPFAPLVASPVPLPARVYIRLGTPIRPGLPRAAAGDQAVVDRVNEEVREAMQRLVDDTLAHRRGIYWSRWDAGAGRGAPVRSPAVVPRAAKPVGEQRVAA